MKKIIFFITVIISVALYAASDKEKMAVEYVKTLIEKSKGANGYIDALRYFQYTSTTAKNNPSSYVLSKYGESAQKESGLDKSLSGKYIPVLKSRTGSRIEKLWKQNREELMNLLPASAYDSVLKSEVDSLVKFRTDSGYAALMKKMKKKAKRPDVKSVEIAGSVTQWSGYRELAFWYRREMEKNDKVVLEIMKELQAHYNR